MSKRIRTEDLDVEPASSPQETITCTIPPCSNQSSIFRTYSEYELHVINAHTYICQSCKHKFPSNGMLNIHIEENHDPFFVIHKQNGIKVYKCLNYWNDPNGCKKVCSDRKKRRLHMIDKHGYPRDYDFSIIDKGI